MQRVLLVEPDYKNKYPPIGLMKLATYHRNKGDYVEFYKGKASYSKISKADRVYITSLFTFYYNETVDTILHYKEFIESDKIFIGGISVSLMPEDYSKDTGIENIIRGQVTSSSIIGYNDGVNIDLLPLDYDILDDIKYEYPSGDNYFVYSTRGCPRECEFCAVKVLEPIFKTTNNILEQVREVDRKYGKKRNMIVMDNNVLWSEQLPEIVRDINESGFTNEPNYVPPNVFSQYMNKIERRIQYGVSYYHLTIKLVEICEKFATRIARYDKLYQKYSEVLEQLKSKVDKLSIFQEHSEYLTCIFEKYGNRTCVRRYVDFNQGIDGRLIDEEVMKELIKIPLKPYRIAYDSLEGTSDFVSSVKLAMSYGVKHFSNYMLYNWEDKPEDLWTRLCTAVELYNSVDDIKGFSFPMKYVPIDKKDRNHIGAYWNKKYLSAINVILNVTKGVVAKEKDFFYEAFGNNIDEYLEILSMPDEFIRFRHFFRDNGLLDLWRKLYRELTKTEKEYLLSILCEMKNDRSVLSEDHPPRIRHILVLYKVNRKQFDNNLVTAEMLLSQIVPPIGNLV